jgi:hypothetical protein
LRTFFFYIHYKNKLNNMNLEIRISTLFVFILTQTIISIFFYMGDNFVSGWEAIFTLILSIPLTYLIQKLRDKLSERK